MTAPAWWLCPNAPPCPHSAALHDIEDYDDPAPMCCIEGCPCPRGGVGMTGYAAPSTAE